MPSLGKLIGRKYHHTQAQNQTNLHRVLLLQHQQATHQAHGCGSHGHEDSGSITNSFIYTSNTTASTALEELDENATDGDSSIIPPENRITLPSSLMSISPSSSITSSSLSSASASTSSSVVKTNTKKKALPVPVKMDLRRVHAQAHGGHQHHHHIQNNWNGCGCGDPSHCSIVDNNSFQVSTQVIKLIG